MGLNDLPVGIPFWVMAVCAMPSSWRQGESGQTVRYNWIRWTYIYNQTLNPGELFEGDGTPYDAALAVTCNIETMDLWAKRDLDIATAISVLHGIPSPGNVRMRGSCSATCVRAGDVGVRVGGWRLGGFN